MMMSNKKLLRLSDEEKGMLQELSARYGMRESELIRFLIVKEYERVKSQ